MSALKVCFSNINGREAMSLVKVSKVDSTLNLFVHPNAYSVILEVHVRSTRGLWVVHGRSTGGSWEVHGRSRGVDGGP